MATRDASPASPDTAPLFAWQRAHGARIAEGSPTLVLDYGDPVAEYACLREGGGLFHDPIRVALELQGEDRTRFLNGLLTCDLRELEEGDGTYGFFTDVKGHVLADAVVVSRGEALHLELPGGSSFAGTVLAHLEKYRVADRVEIRRREDLVALTLLGPAVAAAVGERLPRGPWEGGVVDLAGVSLLLVRDPHRGVDAWTAWVAGGDAAGVAEHLVERCDVLPVGFEALEVSRVEAGWPRCGNDFDAHNLPQETGLEVEAVSYEKGCYLGQEVVARLHYRGQAARRMCRLLVEGEDLPACGALLLDGREVGDLTSVVRSPRYGRPVGLGVVQRRAEGGGAVETQDGIRALVEELRGTDVPRETSPSA